MPAAGIIIEQRAIPHPGVIQRQMQDRALAQVQTPNLILAQVAGEDAHFIHQPREGEEQALFTFGRAQDEGLIGAGHGARDQLAVDEDAVGVSLDPRAVVNQRQMRPLVQGRMVAGERVLPGAADDAGELKFASIVDEPGEFLVLVEDERVVGLCELPGTEPQGQGEGILAELRLGGQGDEVVMTVEEDCGLLGAGLSGRGAMAREAASIARLARDVAEAQVAIRIRAVFEGQMQDFIRGRNVVVEGGAGEGGHERELHLFHARPAAGS